HRRSILVAIPLLPVARLDSFYAEAETVDDFRRWRDARRGRLVDGVVGTCRQRLGQGLAISSGVPHDLCLRRLRRGAVDRAATGAAGAERGAAPLAARRCAHRPRAAGADLSRRAGRRARRGFEIQHLAADRRWLDAVTRPAVLHPAALAQSVRERPDGAVQSPYGG